MRGWKETLRTALSSQVWRGRLASSPARDCDPDSLSSANLGIMGHQRLPRGTYRSLPWRRTCKRTADFVEHATEKSM